MNRIVQDPLQCPAPNMPDAPIIGIFECGSDNTSNNNIKSGIGSGNAPDSIDFYGTTDNVDCVTSGVISGAISNAHSVIFRNFSGVTGTANFIVRGATSGSFGSAQSVISRFSSDVFSVVYNGTSGTRIAFPVLDSTTAAAASPTAGARPKNAAAAAAAKSKSKSKLAKKECVESS